MKPLRHKQQEALARRKVNLNSYLTDKNAIEFFKDGVALTTDAEKQAFLARKIATAEADIAKLEEKIGDTY